VKLGWVVDHDDVSQQCAVLFEEPTGRFTDDIDEAPFRLKANRNEKRKPVSVRERSAYFHFQVIKRYGQKCAFCEISEPRLLEAAHIRPVSENGSDDPRNGLVLCANHHKAFDAGLVGINPLTNELVSLRAGAPLHSIGICKTSIRHLPSSPHPEAIAWAWTSQSSTKPE
jgi:putative restriction endonuclease